MFTHRFVYLSWRSGNICIGRRHCRWLISAPDDRYATNRLGSFPTLGFGGLGSTLAALSIVVGFVDWLSSHDLISVVLGLGALITLATTTNRLIVSIVTSIIIIVGLINDLLCG